MFLSFRARVSASRTFHLLLCFAFNSSPICFKINCNYWNIQAAARSSERKLLVSALKLWEKCRWVGFFSRSITWWWSGRGCRTDVGVLLQQPDIKHTKLLLNVSDTTSTSCFLTAKLTSTKSVASLSDCNISLRIQLVSTHCKYDRTSDCTCDDTVILFKQSLQYNVSYQRTIKKTFIKHTVACGSFVALVNKC